MLNETSQAIMIVARIAHEVNRAYCEALGDMSQPVWEDAPGWQVQSAIDGVTEVLKNPDMTPEQSHALWSQAKLAEGWTWGINKDPVAKKHPCLVPYENLPLNQRIKDHLFLGVVRATMKKK